MKKTRWFPARMQPVRAGVYETRFNGAEGFSEWNGHWSNQYLTAERAHGMSYFAGEQKKEWRGLAEKPE